jgi:glyoxalase superfamily protein
MQPAACTPLGDGECISSNRSILVQPAERVSNASTDHSVRSEQRITRMRTFLDAKAMAKTLRSSLGDKQISLSHSECLEIVAAQFGLDNWNVLAARLAGAAGDGTATPSSAGPQLKVAIPILRIFSVEKAKEFYVDFLGFGIDWEHRFGDNFPLYAQVSRAGLKLHLSEHHGDASPGSTVFIWMRGIADYHRELLAKNYRYYRPGLEKAPWDAWVMEVGDPFGNKLRMSEPFAADDPRA